MKRIIKSRISAFVLGAIIFGSIGVYAANYAASQITYKDITVDEALNYLYNNTCTDWVEIEGATEQDASYVYDKGTHLYKCGNVCRINFKFDGVALNTNYKLIKNENYYPSSDIEGTGIGASNGYMTFKLTTSGNIVITSQSKNNTGWASSHSIPYICNN